MGYDAIVLLSWHLRTTSSARRSHNHEQGENQMRYHTPHMPMEICDVKYERDLRYVATLGTKQVG